MQEKRRKSIELLKAISRAFANFRNKFKADVSTDILWQNFYTSLQEDLNEFELVYDYIWGKDTVNVDGVTKDYIPKVGDTAIMDISVCKDGVWVDVTRTFFVGEYSEEQKEIFDIIVESIRAGEKALKVNNTANQVYIATNAVFEKYNKSLIHHAGHKIAKKVIDNPRFIEQESAIIDSGVYAIESGYYQDFGIRLENDYSVSNQGNENLFENIMGLDIKEYVLK